MRPVMRMGQARLVGRSRELRALVEALERARRGHPDVRLLTGEAGIGKSRLVREDLHWADRSSLDLISFLARNLSDERLLMLLTYRSEDRTRSADLWQLAGELVRQWPSCVMELPPLGRAELAELVRDITAEDMGAGFVDRLLARSDGNPFFVEEL